MKKITLILSLFAFMTATACNRDNSLAEEPTTNTENPNSETNQTQGTMKITIGNAVFTATLADTNSAKAFKEKLPLTLNMSDYGGFEKMVNIGTLPSADKLEKSLVLGDLMLYSSNTLVLYYANHGGYSYTRIGKINDTKGLREALGSGDVSVKFELDN